LFTNNLAGETRELGIPETLYGSMMRRRKTVWKFIRDGALPKVWVGPAAHGGASPAPATAKATSAMLGGVRPNFALRIFVCVLVTGCLLCAGERLHSGSLPLQNRNGLEPRCGGFEPFLQRVAAAGNAAAKGNLVDEFVACVKEKDGPLIEPGTKEGFGRAIFLYRGGASLVALAGDMNGWVPNLAFTPLSETNLFYLSQEYELDARLDYNIVLNDKQWIFDPFNSRKISDGTATNSYFTMPGYAVPPELGDTPSMRHGTIEDFPIGSRIAGAELAAKIYLPPGYNGSKERYKTLYVVNGLKYLEFGKINEIVDGMIQRNEIPPILMVLLGPMAPGSAGAQPVDYPSVIQTEIVRAVEEKYRTRTDAASRGVLGESSGGLIAIGLAGRFSDAFGRCAAQSTTYAPDTNFENLVGTERSDVRMHMDVGTYETSVGKVDVLAENRRLRDFMVSKGFPVEYREVHDGHNWGNWPSRIPEILRYFWALPMKKK
jgi:enterochelin esterase-like enzyme